MGGPAAFEVILRSFDCKWFWLKAFVLGKRAGMTRKIHELKAADLFERYDCVLGGEEKEERKK